MSSETNESPAPAIPAEARRGDTEGDGSGATDAATLRQELEAARAERDAAVRSLDRHGRRVRVAKKLRYLLLGALVVLFSLLVPLSVTFGWFRTTVASTDGWVSTVGPIPSNPAVASALGIELTNQIFTALGVQQQVASVLPPRATYLAGPITNGVKGYVQQAVTKVIASPQFNTLWTEANRFAHAQLVAVLEGNSKAVKATNGTVVLDLVPTLNAALAQIQDVVSGIVGRPVTLPTLSGNEVPSAACSKISDALGVALPANCAQIPLFPADKLTRAQDLVRRLHNGVTLLFVVTPAVGLVALWASDRRRRTLLQLLGGAVIGLVVFRRAVIWLQHTLVNTGKPENKAARQAILDQVLHNFFIMSAWILVGLVAVAAVATVTGRYGWARSLRGSISTLATGAWGGARAAVISVGASAAPGWIGGHTVLLQVTGGALAVILLLTLPVSFVGFLIVAGIAVAYEIELEHIKRVRRLQGTPVGLRNGSRTD